MKKNCPVCAEPLEQIREESSIISKLTNEPLEKNLWWCYRCQEYVFDEDFLYENED